MEAVGTGIDAAPGGVSLEDQYRILFNLDCENNVVVGADTLVLGAKEEKGNEGTLEELFEANGDSEAEAESEEQEAEAEKEEPICATDTIDAPKPAFESDEEAELNLDFTKRAFRAPSAQGQKRKREEIEETKKRFDFGHGTIADF